MDGLSELSSPSLASSAMEPNNRSPIKRALLIGITYNDCEESCLEETGADSTMLRDFLIDHAGYLPENVLLMTDAGETKWELKPTKINVLKQTRNFVADAIDGDHFLFYFAGHSSQIMCKHKTEDDDEDEVILCSDGKKIKDNKLHKLLVHSLPIGASLTAIFDACHSGTLLDLPHYTCNSVYVPWLNKGNRKSDTLWNNIRRQNAVSATSMEHEPETNESVSINADLSGSFRRIQTAPCEDVSSPLPSISVSFQFRRFPSMGDVLDIVNHDKDSYKPDSHGTTPLRPTVSTTLPVSNNHVDDEEFLNSGSRQCSSPENMWPRLCDGDCRKEARFAHDFSKPHRQVVSLSSSRDNQITWEDTGASMTAYLIEILKKNKTPSYHQMMTELQHKLHSYMMEMHRYAKEETRRRKRSGSTEEVELEIEMNDFQDPQLGSIIPLNMDDIFIL